MVNPIINQQVSRAGGQEQSLAASATMIITGLEKELNQKIHNIKTNLADPKTQLQALESYIEELSATTTVEEIQKRREREDKDKEQGFSGKQSKPKEKKAKNTPSPGKTVELKTRLQSTPATKAMDPKLLREYIILQVKKQTGIPEEEQESVLKRLLEIEEIFKQEKIPKELIQIQKAKTEIIVKEELLSLIKSLLFQNLNNPYAVFEKILSHEKSSHLIKIASGSAEPEAFPIKELVQTAKDLGINLDHWIAYWNFEKIRINPSGNITITPQIAEEKSFLKDSFRSLYIEFLLSGQWLEKTAFYLKIRKETKILKQEGILEAEINTIIEQAKHLAWLKIITMLKDLHLKRVLSSSEEDFFSYSKKIGELTQKAKKLTKNITEKGHNLIESKLETLALDAARYKLEFLKSMQNIEYQKERERDILWIEHLMARLSQGLS